MHAGYFMMGHIIRLMNIVLRFNCFGLGLIFQENESCLVVLGIICASEIA